MRIGLVRSAAAMALAAFVMLHAGTAHAQKVYSASGGAPSVIFNGNTTVARLKVPAGSYVVSGSGIVRNNDATDVAYIECTLQATNGTIGAIVDLNVPSRLSPGVPGGNSWSFSTTLVGATSPSRIRVRCANFGPVANAQVEGSFWTLVAVPVSSVRHTDH